MSETGRAQARAFREHELRQQDKVVKAMRWACLRSGYALAVHGTRARDLDLIAVPWAPDADSAGRLLSRLVDAEFIHSTPEKKPHGRVAYTLYWRGTDENREMGCLYVDLSVMPRQTPKTRRAHS